MPKLHVKAIDWYASDDLVHTMCGQVRPYLTSIAYDVGKRMLSNTASTGSRFAGDICKRCQSGMEKTNATL